MEIKYINGEYKIIGEFDYGFAGKFVNDENGNGNIKLQLNKDDFALLKAEPTDSKKVIKKLTKSINNFQSLVLKHNQVLRGLYIYDVFFDLLYVDINKQFWQDCIDVTNYHENAEIKKEADEFIANYLKRSEDNIDKITDELDNIFDGELIKKKKLPNIDEYLKKNFKFYDFDKFFASIKPSELIFDAKTFGVCLSNAVADKYDCSFSARFDKNLEKTFWW